VIRRAEHPFIPACLNQIDPLFVEATLAAEDRRFFTHPGVDPAAALRAAWQNIRSGRMISGGSTLTQQLVNLLDAQPPPVNQGEHGRDIRESAWGRKLRTAWLALALETRWSKKHILEAYFNLASYGTDLQGVRAACRTYFSHDPDTLTLEQAALLAALPQSPVRLDPRRRPADARTARNRVLQRMKIDGGTRSNAEARSLGIVAAPPVPGTSIAPHWMARLAQLPHQVCEVRLPLDRSLQIEASAALRDVMLDLEDLGADAGGVVVIHNSSGEMRASVGSPDWEHPGHGQVDGTMALRQPGSALKPFAYAMAFERGLRPSSILPDLPLSHPGTDGVFRPRNYSGLHRGPVRARIALANSWNAPAVALLSELGAAEFLDLLHSLGLNSLDRPAGEYGLGLILGVGEVTLADLTAAYACLARGGVFFPRMEILEALDSEGSPVPNPNPEQSRTLHDPDGATAAQTAPHRIFGTDACFLTLSILSDEEARAPAFGRGPLLTFPYAAAIKTGTSSDWRDNWAFGLTEEWTVGVWVGTAGGGPMDRVSGTRGALRVMRKLLDYLHEDSPGDTGPDDPTAAEPGRFTPPWGFERRWICALSGMPAGPRCPGRVPEWFSLSDPQSRACDWHLIVEIDSASGLLARECTPEDRVHEALFVQSGSVDPIGSPPGIFEPWFREQGLPLPPSRASACECLDPQCRPLHRLSPGPRFDDAAPASTRIWNPVDGSVYFIDPTLPAAQQAIALEGSGDGVELVWFVNGEEYARTRHGERVFWPLSPGCHEIVLRSHAHGGQARVDAVRIVVEEGG